MMASALRKFCDKQTHVPKKVSVEELRAQRNDRFSRGGQIAFMIYDLSDLVSIRLHIDDIQDFDLRW